jgi:hypothetical protein
MSMIRVSVRKPDHAAGEGLWAGVDSTQEASGSFVKKETKKHSSAGLARTKKAEPHE